MPADTIGSWADLQKIFVGNFRGTYVRPGNSWDLKSCKQEPSESLPDYIWHFSKQYNSHPDVISAFLSRTSCKSLVHKLGCQKPRTIHELLDIATNHASSEEADGAIFVRDQPRAKKKRDNPDEPSAGREGRKNKKNH